MPLPKTSFRERLKEKIRDRSQDKHQYAGISSTRALTRSNIFSVG